MKRFLDARVPPVLPDGLADFLRWMVPPAAMAIALVIQRLVP